MPLGRPKPWTDQRIAAHLRRRRRLRLASRFALALLLLSIAADHLNLFGQTGNDWSHFDHRQAIVLSIPDNQSAVVNLPNGRQETIHLLGVAAWNNDWEPRAIADLTTCLKGKTITLNLDPTQTRDQQGRLLAYAFLAPGDLVNADIVRDGIALADRRQTYALHGEVEGAETDARKKHRGLWAEMTDATMPPWRRQWLDDRRAQEPKSIAQLPTKVDPSSARSVSDKTPRTPR